MMQGKFLLAEEELVTMSQSIYPDFYEKLLSVEDLTFYIILVLVVCFKNHVLKTIVSS